MAKERGLEPLAKKILAQEKGVDPMKLAEGYVNAENGVNTSEDALNGAKDIIAETISDDAVMRRRLRMAAMAQGVITSRAAKDEDPCIACIMNSLSRRQKSQATAFWRWTAASARAF